MFRHRALKMPFLAHEIRSTGIVNLEKGRKGKEMYKATKSFFT